MTAKCRAWIADIKDKGKEKEKKEATQLCYVGRNCAEWKRCSMSLIAHGTEGRLISKLTSLGTHLIACELERHDADEYESYEYSELEYNPENRPH
jgi:hypothetical protein